MAAGPAAGVVVDRRSTDARAAITAMSAHSGELHDHLVEALLANLDPDDANS